MSFPKLGFIRLPYENTSVFRLGNRSNILTRVPAQVNHINCPYISTHLYMRRHTLAIRRLPLIASVSHLSLTRLKFHCGFINIF